MGFDVQLLSACVCVGNELTEELDHMLLLVSLDSEVGRQHYLVDLGLGQSCSEPMLIAHTDEYSSENCTYCLGLHLG